MKYLANICRIIVGVIFIISGLIKLNDPMGFAFKLEDYFAPNVLNMPYFVPYALALAVLVCIFEVVLGVALLVGYRKKQTLWLLLAMLVFFGFLTFYSAYYNKVTDCGCFGDAIKFTPWQSFTKDLVLLALTLVICAGQRYIKPISKGRLPLVLTLLSVVFCMGFVYYVYNHLPIKDFRAYKIGVNIPQAMEVPKDKIVYHWTVEMDGKVQQITNRGDFPKDSKGDWAKVIEVKDEKPKAPIHDFFIENRDKENLLGMLMQEEKLLLVVAYRLDRTHQEAFKGIKEVTDKAMKKGYKVVGLTSQIEKAPYIMKKYELNFNFYFSDATTLKTMIRANPGLILLSKGTIIDKKHYNDREQLSIR
nr:BT_3928 family protein [uncultured Capnocytophaga sp.]